MAPVLIIILLGFLTPLYNKNKNFVGYFVAALTGVLVQYLVGTVFLINYLGWESKLSFAIGFIVSFPVGFILTKLLAFDARNSGKTQREMIKYMLTVIASGFITVYGSEFSIQLLAEWFGSRNLVIPVIHHEFKNPAGSIGHFMGMGMSFVFNFIVHKKFTFHQTGLWDKFKGYFV